MSARLALDGEGEVVLDCGGRTLAAPYVQTGPLLPLGRPHASPLLPKRPVNFPLSQAAFISRFVSGSKYYRFWINFSGPDLFLSNF
jgi:hypothetical protein